MMALNRYRLRHSCSSAQPRRAARVRPARQTDKFLGVVLLGNNVINAASALLVGEIARRYFGDSELALVIATGAAAFFILVFSEITPKVIGAAYPERIALPASYVLTPLLQADAAVRLVREPLRAGAAEAHAPRSPQAGGASTRSRSRSCARSCSRPAISRRSTRASSSTSSTWRP